MANPVPTTGKIPQLFVSDGTKYAAVWKTTPGTLNMLSCANLSSTPYYVHVFDASSDPGTAGTSVLEFMVPPNPTTAADGHTFNAPIPPQGINFNNGIVLHVTANAADTDETPVAANDAIVNGATG